MHCFYACSNQKATTNSYLRVKKSDPNISIRSPLYAQQIPAYPFLDKVRSDAESHRRAHIGKTSSDLSLSLFSPPLHL